MTPEYIARALIRKGQQPAVLTTSSLRYWFRMLNIAEFSNQLPVPQFNVYSDVYDGTFGWMCYDDSSAMIQLNNVYAKTFAEFIGTMLHEMLHYEQWLSGESVDHTYSFALKAATLRRRYSIDV